MDNTSNTKCPDGELPDGPVCPKCGEPRLPSGVDGGTWVHFPIKNISNILKDSELGITFMPDQAATIKEPPQRDETLDLFNLLDCLLLKTNFKIAKNTKDPDQLRILNNAFYRVLGELKNQSIYTPISSMPRLVIAKSKKPEIEKYLKEQKIEIQKELNATDKEFNNSLATFSWTWVWFSFAKLTSQDITKRYHTLVVTGLTNTLEGLLKALKETTTETYKLRAKEDKLALFTELKSILEMLRDSTNIAGFIKVLSEAQKDITPAEAENGINRGITNIKQALKNDIIKTKKAPRKVILC
jgi:hypothetical protein